MTTLVHHLTPSDLLDQTRHALLGSDIHAGMGHLRATLRGLRADLPADHWKALGERLRRHPVHELLLESPFAKRAFSKPRGYPGDARLMDLINSALPEALFNRALAMEQSGDTSAANCRLDPGARQRWRSGLVTRGRRSSEPPLYALSPYRSNST